MLRDRQAVWRHSHRHRHGPRAAFAKMTGARAVYLSHRADVFSSFLALRAPLPPLRPRRYPGRAGALRLTLRGGLQVGCLAHSIYFFTSMMRPVRELTL